MTIVLRAAQESDMPFMRKMLYEAVFWRKSASTPSMEEGLAFPEVSLSLEDWGKRRGDTYVIATIDSKPAGAAWYRFWTDEHFTRGYVDKTMPVVVIAVDSEYRHQGIGGKMIRGLIDAASKQGIPKISLSVSKDNYAINLYRQQGFLEHEDTGDSFLMVRKI